MLVAIDTPLICLVDDDASVRGALLRLLRSVGLNARAFENPLEFLEFATHEPMRLAILDVSMPEMSGLEVQARLHETAPQSAVILMTARDDIAIRNAALKGGATAFLVKPISEEVLLAAVQSVLAA